MSDMEVREKGRDAFRKLWWLEPCSLAFTGLGVFMVILSLLLPFIWTPVDISHNVSPFFPELGFICVFAPGYAITRHRRKAEERRIDELEHRRQDEWIRQENERLEARLREVAHDHPSHKRKKNGAT